MIASDSLPPPELREWSYPFPFPFPNSQMSFPLTSSPTMLYSAKREMHNKDLMKTIPVLHCLALYCTILHYLVLSCTIFHYLALSCTTLHYLALSCTILQCCPVRYTCSQQMSPVIAFDIVAQNMKVLCCYRGPV